MSLNNIDEIKWDVPLIYVYYQSIPLIQWQLTGNLFLEQVTVIFFKW